MPNAETTAILSALQTSGLQTDAPTLYDVLRQLALTLDSTSTQTIAQQTVAGDSPAVANVSNFQARSDGRDIYLSWNYQAGQNFVSSGISFEVRKGSTWATATFATLTNTNSIILPKLAVGTYTYLIKAFNGAGTYSVTETPTTFSVVAPKLQTITTGLIGRYPNLSWT